MKTWLYRGLISGVVFGLAFMLAQVATNTTFAQLPAVSAGGTLNLISNGIGLLFNTDSAGGRALFGPVFPMTAPPTTSWTNVNCGTFDTTQGYPYLSAPYQAADALCVEYRTALAAPYTCKALIYHDISGAPPGLSGTANLGSYGLGFRDGTGKLVTLEALTNGLTPGFLTSKWNSATSQSAGYLQYSPSQTNSGAMDFVFRNPAWLAIGDDNTNLNFYWSIDGVGIPGTSGHWKLFDSRSRTDWLASGPTQVAIVARPQGSAVEMAVPSWSCQ